MLDRAGVDESIEVNCFLIWFSESENITHITHSTSKILRIKYEAIWFEQITAIYEENKCCILGNMGEDHFNS